MNKIMSLTVALVLAAAACGTAGAQATWKPDRNI